MLHTHSLRSRLMVVYLLIFLVPALIMIGAMPFYFQNSLSGETQALTEGTLTSLTRNIETYLDDLNRLTLSPYLNEEILRALKLKASPNYDQADDYTKLMANRALETTLPLFLQTSRQDILATMLVSPNGWAFVTAVGSSSSEPVDGYPYMQQDWYRRALEADGNGVFISSHPQDYLSDRASQQVFSVARLIKDPDTRRPLGVMMADADTSVLASIVDDIPFNVSAIICIFDYENKLLYASRPVSPNLQRQALSGPETVEDDGNSYVRVEKVIPSAQWKVLVLLSDAEITAKARWLYLVGVLFAAGGLLLTFVLFYALSRWIVQPFQKMIAVMKQVQDGDLQTRFVVTGNDEIGALGQALNTMIEQLNQLIDREYKAVLSQRNAEYRALQSQIRPHFLYNTLNGFIGLNRLKDTQRLEQAIFSLSGMLRYTLEGEDLVPLKHELTFIREYCDLQRLRFADRLQVEICCEPDLELVKLPRLLLQPLVENAVIHGIEPIARHCTLRIMAERVTAPVAQTAPVRGGPADRGLVQAGLDGEPPEEPVPVAPLLRITIEDNGRGFDPQRLDGEHGLGLANVRERLLMAFPEACFTISSQPGMGTKIVIELPLPAA